MSGVFEHVLTDAEADEIIAAGTKPWELLRLVDPHLPQRDCEWLLWNATPFPMLAGVHDLVDWLAVNGLPGDLR